MPVHIYKRGNLSKKADEGLTFEQQMGTMTSARLSEKFPMLSPYLVGFEVLDKDDDGTYGVGTMVYLMGNQAFYIPSFYNHGRMNTGEIIVLRDQQQFIPATEGLISYMKSRYDKGMGTIFPKMKANVQKGAPGSVKVKEEDFPIRKSASLGPDSVNMLDSAIKMGKQASAQMIDIISSDTRMFNEFTSYYGLDKIASFRDAFEAQHAPKQAAKDTWVIDSLDKSASKLTADERKALNTFGFLIKTAKDEFPDVKKIDQVSEQFSTITETGFYEVLDKNGKLHDAVVIRMDDTPCLCGCDPINKNINSAPSRFLKQDITLGNHPVFMVVLPDGSNSSYGSINYTPTGRRIGDGKVTFDIISKLGKTIGDIDVIDWGDVIIAPNGSVFTTHDKYVPIDGDKTSLVSACGNKTINVCDVIDSIVDKDTEVRIPEGCVVIKNIQNENKPEDMTWDEWEVQRAKKRSKTPQPARPADIQTALMNYINSNYTTVKIFSNGSGFTVSGDNSEPKDMSIKEASFTLTNNYGVDPLDAPHMVIAAYPADGVSNSSVRWCIEKKAAGGDYSRGASPYDIPNLGYSEVSHEGPQTETIGSDAVMPTQGATREDILKQVQRAADSGVKEIFDVSLMKVLVKTSRPEALLGDYYTTILKMMDRLCRMLFLGYVKEDDFKNQYGDDKYEEYLETIRNSMADLSELFIFISTRSVIEDTMDTDGADDLTDGNI